MSLYADMMRARSPHLSHHQLDRFDFSGCSAEGAMGTVCAHTMKPHVRSGAHVLVDSAGTAVGEGVCCNGVENSVMSAVRVKCKAPPPPAPASSTPRPTSGSYHVSRLATVVSLVGVSNVTFAGLEIRFARGAGVSIVNSTGVVLDTCTVANHGMMAVNVTGGASNGLRNSEVSGNGNGGVVLYGGDRDTLTSSHHFVEDSALHHNQRWILNYAPHVFMGGVGQRVRACCCVCGDSVGG